MCRFSSTLLVTKLYTLKALLCKEYPTKNPSSDFPTNLPKWSMVFKMVTWHPKEHNKQYLCVYPAHTSEVPFEQQPDPSPRSSPRPSPRPSPTPIVPDSIPEPTGKNLGDHSSNDTSLSRNEDDMTLPNVYDLCISLCKQVSDQAKEIKLLKANLKRLYDAQREQLSDASVEIKAYTLGLKKVEAITPSNLSMQRNVEYPRRYIIGSIAQDL
ncbi:hypothetical protein Tco_1224141, partial [Tanacetum coccineum]